MCVCMCVLCMCQCVCVCICTCVLVMYAHVCLCVFLLHMCACISMYAHVCVFVYVYVSVYMYMWMSTYVCVCIVYLKQTADISASHFSPLSGESDVYHNHISLGNAELAKENLKLSPLSLCRQPGGSGNLLLHLNTKSHSLSDPLSFINGAIFFHLKLDHYLLLAPSYSFLIQLCPGFLTAPSKHISYLHTPEGRRVLTSPFV